MTVRPAEQRTNLLNVARFVLSRPSRFPALVHKVVKRLRGESDQRSAENDSWLAQNSVSAEDLAKPIDSRLWEEAVAFDAEQQAHARAVLDTIPYDLGGGGDHRFLYWLTRYRQPEVVVETGVAAGWSSRAFLTALQKNGHGRLYSSDLPYFRLPNPERFVGVLVEKELRGDWVPELDGDQANLPRIVAKVDRIDIVHYDSDKRSSGRDFAIKLLKTKLAPDGLILMDDIFDDSWFRNYVTSTGKPFHVVDGKYGIIGDLERQSGSSPSPAAGHS